MTTNIRRRYRLPTLNYSKPLESRHCRFDLVRMRFNSFHIRTSPTFDITDFTQFLANSDICSRTGSSKRKLTFKKHWLFGGQIYLQQSTSGFNIVIQLDLNLSRFLSLCSYPVDEWSSISLEELLQTNTELEAAQSLSTFNDATNMLPQEQWAYSQDQERLFGLYLALVQNFLEEQIKLAAQYDENLDPNRILTDDDCQLMGNWGECVIYRTEAYHEFFCPDALSSVHALRDKMREAISSITERIYTVPQAIQEDRIRWRTQQNALALSCNMERKNIDLIVYAKAPRRIRFEVRYNESLKGLLGGGLGFEAPSGGGLTSSDVALVLSKTREDATERLGYFMEAIAEVTSTKAPSMEAFLDLMNELNVACHGDGLLMRDLLSILTNNKAVSKPKDADDRLAGAVERLINRKIVERARIAKRNRSHRYIVAGKYRGSLERVYEALYDDA